jgi:hypothetical protein
MDGSTRKEVTMKQVRLIPLVLVLLLPRAGASQAPEGTAQPPAGASPAPAAGDQAPDRAHTLAAEATAQKPVFCGKVKDFHDCHATYPDGCTVKSTPKKTPAKKPAKKPAVAKYDAYLNFLKNQMPENQPATGTLTSADISGKEKQLPVGMNGLNHGKFAGDLTNLGEGNIYTLVGYLYYHMPGGQETCNCKLKGEPNVDKHLGVGFDPEMAQRIASGQVHKGPIGASTDVDRTSMIVEMTPAYRDRFHPQWTDARLDAAVGKQVKVVGQLLVDNDHLNIKDDCGFEGAKTATCWRMSAWELHPALEFYVCKKGVGCGDDPNDWQKLDDLPGT